MSSTSQYNFVTLVRSKKIENISSYRKSLNSQSHVLLSDYSNLHEFENYIVRSPAMSDIYGCRSIKNKRTHFLKKIIKKIKN